MEENAQFHARILRLRRDADGDWVADLGCGHSRHVRHDPPWTNRPWITTAPGRRACLGTLLHCGTCEKMSACDTTAS